MQTKELRTLLGAVCIALSFSPCTGKEQKTRITEQPWSISFSSSKSKGNLIWCAVENGQHIYYVDIAHNPNGEPTKAAAINIINGKGWGPKIQFDWEATNAKPTCEPEIRVQFEKIRGFTRYFETVSKGEYSSIQLGANAKRITYTLAEKKSYFPMRISIVGRGDAPAGTHIKISNLKVGGIRPGKTLPWMIGAHDPILSKRCGIWDDSWQKEIDHQR
ncbi:MAG TPA: hypothetical protein EYN91_19945 [Candidatus Melainabacteria bacterium]|nr:hypothetical protein [Candidatus Melainabacteria bacterium]